jgi:hypothetical protein
LILADGVPAKPLACGFFLIPVKKKGQGDNP